MYNLEQIIAGYAQGYFLMAEEDGLEWFSATHRTIMPLDHRFHHPKSLRRQLNQDRFRVAINQAFEAVIEGCADRPTTWISSELKEIYLELYQAGWAYSFETWQDDQLAGGILGIAINGLFVGESMFYRIPEGSKVAMVRLVEHLRVQGFQLFDVQLNNPHLERFGAYEVSDRVYQQLLKSAVTHPCAFVAPAPNSPP
ncbi:MAG: leucyl/phenylalanyl-tRNA--protein transferase [Pseudanabaenaceae cyanobacterium bins.68]|nr:leucyl/phenylalanyl-tRNA--protein transferase [Pseudanabaenaceae cyanobacterium bins.68]